MIQEPGVRLEDDVRADAYDLMRRLVRHHADNTTDLADGQWHEPVVNYSDPETFRREIERVHRRVPLPLAMSREIDEPGSYKAIDVAGIPVVITRDTDGQVHAMINSCRHRGAKIVGDGCGRANRLTCPYHAWAYDLSGCLLGVYGEKTFGPVDRVSRSLIALPVEERAGIIFVGLTPGTPLDIDEWLGDMLPILQALRLDRLHIHSRASFPGPNWKLVVDGFLETYHFATLHRTTVFPTSLSNIATFDAYGRHLRYCYARRGIAEVAKQPLDQTDPTRVLGPVTWVFPGLSIAGGLRNHTVVSLVLPGRHIGESVTHQTTLLRVPPATDVELKEADQVADLFHDVLVTEDYPVCEGIEQGLDALAGTDFVFGRNEPAVQHFHRVLGSIVGRNGQTPAS
jgi:phenylpropionate dioxygenase-like ring-hydroxylating dioxygenase large terminal subunit